MIVEIVACSVEDCLAVERAGAHRIELCTGIVAGGVTPSIGLTRACIEATKLPIMAMVRPREGGFCYSSEEFETMCRELDAFVELGVAGVVIGILHSDGSIDTARMAKLVRRAAPMTVMCHRAFDVTPDPIRALDDLIEAGVHRVLSSGQSRDIIRGLPRLVEIMAHAKGRIEVQPCEGIRPDNVGQVMQMLNPGSIHLGPFVQRFDPTSSLGSEVEYGPHLEVDEAVVRQVVEMTRS